MEVTQIIAIRHGETAWNVDTRLQGHLDIPLNDVGYWQAQQTAKALAHEDLDAIYSSNLQRAWETARLIHEENGAPIHESLGLRERCFGEFQGKTFAELEISHPKEAHLWRIRDPHFAPAQGESLADFRERIITTVSVLAAQHIGKQIALVAHGGVLDVLYRVATGQSIQAPRTWSLGNATINRLLWTPQGLTLVGWADVQHLQTDECNESEVVRDEVNSC